MRRLKQAIRGRIHAIQARLYQRVEELAFQASVRAIKETHWMVQGAAHNSALTAIDGMHQALAAYVPPTPWAEAWVDEVTQVLDSVIAEQFRLQSQIEGLERLLLAQMEAGGRRQETGGRAA